MKGQSIPWQPVDLRIAESLRVSLLEVILRLSDITEVERRAVEESAYKAGARDVKVIEESLAAAIGMGIGAAAVNGMLYRF